MTILHGLPVFSIQSERKRRERARVKYVFFCFDENLTRAAHWRTLYLSVFSRFGLKTRAARATFSSKQSNSRQRFSTFILSSRTNEGVPSMDVIMKNVHQLNALSSESHFILGFGFALMYSEYLTLPFDFRSRLLGYEKLGFSSTYRRDNSNS